MQQPARPINLAVLVSGSGTTLQNLIDRCADGSLPAHVSAVVASKPGLAAEPRATAAGVPYAVVARRDHPDDASHSAAVFAACGEADLVVCAGWLALLRLPERFRGRVMNVHPSLLPAFGGRGMYGRHVHAAVIAHGCKLSGCTVHLVDDAYDTGPIVLQRACPVLDDDTPETLAARVQAEERVALPEAIRLFAEGRLRVEGRRVSVADR